MAADLARAGIGLFAISYDPVEALAAFATKHGTTYPLLADEGSRVIREMGMMDADLDRHHAEFGRQVRDDQRGVTYPAVFLLDGEGNVAAKRFHPRYRIRDTGAGLLATVLGIDESEYGPEAAAETDAVRVRAYFTSPEYRPYQVVPLTVELTIKTGWHVYTPAVPDGYTALSAELAPLEGVDAAAAVWPADHVHHVEGLDETFSVLDGTVRGRIAVTFAVAAGAGDQRPEVVVHFQACSDRACLPPATVRLSLLVREAALAE